MVLKKAIFKETAQQVFLHFGDIQPAYTKYLPLKAGNIDSGHESFLQSPKQASI